jgi:hypothetical protein
MKGGLRGMSNLIRRTPVAVALALWIGAFYELMLIALNAFRGKLSETMVGPLLTTNSWEERAAPIAILVVFGACLGSLFLHGVRVSRESSALKLVSGWVPRTLKTVPPGLRASRRAELARTYLSSSPERLRDALPAAAGVDATAIEDDYTTTKTLIWCLPVFGFIGTAQGMAHAISGFSDALQLQRNDMGVLTDRLAQQVIPGLAGAFSTTMLALVAATIGHFCVMALQGWDQDLLHELDGMCVELVAKMPSGDGGHYDSGGGTDMAQALVPLVQRLSLLAPAIDAMERLMEGLGPLSGAGLALEQAARAAVDSGSKVHQAAGSLHQAAELLRAAADATHREASLPYKITVTRG